MRRREFIAGAWQRSGVAARGAGAAADDACNWDDARQHARGTPAAIVARLNYPLSYAKRHRIEGCPSGESLSYGQNATSTAADLGSFSVNAPSVSRIFTTASEQRWAQRRSPRLRRLSTFDGST
jgi:hypothetical protein